MQTAPKLDSARYPWLLELVREVCEQLQRPPVRPRFNDMLDDWFSSRKHEPEISADDFLPDDDEAPQASRTFLPSTGVLTLAEKYARVAAIHNAVCERCPEINPWLSHGESYNADRSNKSIALFVLTKAVNPRELPDTEATRNRIEAIWREVRADLTADPRKRLLTALADADEHGLPLAGLPHDLLDADLLTDSDALGWIEFGNRDSVTVSGEGGPRLELGNTWTFGSRNLPGYKSMRDIIDEASRENLEHSDLGTHVRLTPMGRAELARMRCGGNVDPVPNSGAAIPAQTSDSGGGKAMPTWTPRPGFVGVKAVCNLPQFQKKGKNPPRTTIEQWVKSARGRGETVTIEKAPDSGENHYPEQWIKDCIARWNPRSPRT